LELLNRLELVMQTEKLVDRRFRVVQELVQAAKVSDGWFIRFRHKLSFGFFVNRRYPWYNYYYI
jgi:hypothetical protein